MPAHFNWIHSSHGHVPENAVESGRTSNGEVLYVGRAFHNGVPCVGKVRYNVEAGTADSTVRFVRTTRYEGYIVSVVFDRFKGATAVCIFRTTGERSHTGTTRSWYRSKSRSPGLPDNGF